MAVVLLLLRLMYVIADLWGAYVCSCTKQQLRLRTDVHVGCLAAIGSAPLGYSCCGESGVCVFLLHRQPVPHFPCTS